MTDDAELVQRLAAGWAKMELSETEAEALAAARAAIVRGLDSFPVEDLKPVEPPLRSIPGPGRSQP